jgi:hypothetical protein
MATLRHRTEARRRICHTVVALMMLILRKRMVVVVTTAATTMTGLSSVKFLGRMGMAVGVVTARTNTRKFRPLDIIRIMEITRDHSLIPGTLRRSTLLDRLEQAMVTVQLHLMLMMRVLLGQASCSLRTSLLGHRILIPIRTRARIQVVLQKPTEQPQRHSETSQLGNIS